VATVPMTPVEYVDACKALQACHEIDEAKYWSDKSDALAAWAKIYRDDETGKLARKLKAHAYRRMGEIAEQVQPTKGVTHKGSPPGANSLLIEKGLSRGKAYHALRIS